MRDKLSRGGVILAAIIAASTTMTRADDTAARLLVRMQRPLSEAVARDAGVRKVAPRVHLTEWRVVTLDAGADPERSAAIFSSDPAVLAVELDRDALVTSRMPDDLRSDQWALENTGQRIGGVPGVYDADIDAPEAWELSTGDRGILVAVLDTGVTADHPDLNGNLLAGLDLFTGGLGADDSALGHGTAVAGILGARGDNSFGMTGVSWNVSLLPLKVCDGQGRCPYSAIIGALDVAVRRGVRVVNLSMTCDEHQDPQTGYCGAHRPGACRSEALRDALRAAGRAGVLIVTAAGNCAEDLDDDTTAYPCAYDLDNLICVGASDQRDEFTTFSNHGPGKVHLAAPGAEIMSLSRDRDRMLPWDGTSFASPFVAGTASILLARNAGMTPRALRARLMDGDPLASLADAVAGGTRLNARRALEGIFLNAASIGGSATGSRGLMGDFDGNGQPDALEIGRRGISVARGNGDALTAFSLWSAVRVAGSPEVGDVDGDGRDDLVVASRRGLSAWLSLGDRFDDGRLFGAGIAWGQVQLADVDGDGRDDAIEARRGEGWLAHRSLGDRFDAPSRWSSLGAGVPWTMVDMDGDGRADLVRLVEGEIGVSLSLGDTFSAERRARVTGDAATPGVTRVMSGDVDGDGHHDLALRAHDGCWEIALAADRDDSGNWTARPWACGREGRTEALADVDGDGRADLVRMAPFTGWSMLRSRR